MEQFLGKWKMVPELTEGLEEYFEAMKIPEALRDTMRKYSNMTAEMTKEGDGYVSVIDHGDRKETIRFQLGVPSLLRLEGDRLLSEETVDGKKSCSTPLFYVTTEELRKHTVVKMEPFLGKWKMVPELTEGFKEYAEAMKIPEPIRETMLKNRNVTVEMTKGDDDYVSVINSGDRTETIRFQLGVPVTTNFHGMEVTSLLRLDGDRLVSEDDMMGVKTRSTRYIKGDKFITLPPLASSNSKRRAERVSLFLPVHSLSVGKPHAVPPRWRHPSTEHLRDSG
ncbi:hypothetical protein BaRGS_00003718 [Batillaria attramentaria]|uniref:Uncharacterized protein n=1 Tax=Batillaria attramentaria TaxID=370345 RepID=A0ABD0M0A6_9CAEN